MALHQIYYIEKLYNLEWVNHALASNSYSNPTQGPIKEQDKQCLGPQFEIYML
ncbi:MAG: hypothetical protein IPO64_06490 [Bacteroidetes bacterium]|nr:hypothetical protein [Bacteroidota bacterium]